MNLNTDDDHALAQRAALAQESYSLFRMYQSVCTYLLNSLSLSLLTPSSGAFRLCVLSLGYCSVRRRAGLHQRRDPTSLICFQLLYGVPTLASHRHPQHRYD
jgi:hypothetical protein